jgi:hypothetical protein
MQLTGQRSLCRSCGLYFKSTAGFDKHRTGTHGVDRRCMTEDEMRAKGMARNGAGLWVTALREFNYEPDMTPTDDPRYTAW